MKHAAATLGSGNLRLAVMLPDGEDLNEWVAVNSKSLIPCINQKLTVLFQLLIFLIKSICYMEPLLNFVQKIAVP